MSAGHRDAGSAQKRTGRKVRPACANVSMQKRSRCVFVEAAARRHGIMSAGHRDAGSALFEKSRTLSREGRADKKF